MTDYTDLIARLRETGLRDDYDAYRAADALEAQARRIAELKAQLLAGNDWLNARHAVLQDLAEANARIAELEAALREAYEVYAGSDGFIPETAAEGYLQQLISEMVAIIGAGLKK